MIIEPATAADVPAIVAVFAANRGDHGLFRERESDVRRNWPNFLVAREADGSVVGCAGVHRDPDGWAELFGVAVLPRLQAKGIGSDLVPKCVEKAAASGVSHLWLGTMKPGYFARFGFHQVPRRALPAAVLLRKLRQVFHQPVEHWTPVLFNLRHTFMLRELNDEALAAGRRAG